MDLDLQDLEIWCPPTRRKRVRQPGVICPPTGRIPCPLSATVKTSRCTVTQGMTFCSITATLQDMPFGAFVGPNDTVTKLGVFVSGGLGGSAAVPSIPRGTPTPLG